jgi:hypothetical protein
VYDGHEFSLLRFVLSDKLHPQTIACVKTRACPFGIKVEVVDLNTFEFSNEIGGVIFQYPDTEGSIHNFTDLVAKAKYVAELYANKRSMHGVDIAYRCSSFNQERGHSHHLCHGPACPHHPETAWRVWSRHRPGHEPEVRGSSRLRRSSRRYISVHGQPLRVCSTCSTVVC